MAIKLLSKPKLNAIISKGLQKRKIIELSETSSSGAVFDEKNAKWIDVKQAKILSRGKPGKILSFIDITDTTTINASSPPPLKVPEIPTRVKYQEVVKEFLPQIDRESEENLRKTITHMSAYATRYATSRTGVEAANWLKSQYDKIVLEIKDPERRSLFKVSLIDHNSWYYSQPSVVVEMRGSDNPELKVILGSHLDSTAGWFQNAPGADDDASGSASVLEIFRILANSDFVPKKTIEFHSYAAEEMGLLGSADIANRYRAAGIKVHVMMQMDMNAYNLNNKNEIALVTNGVTAEVTEFVRKCIKEYCEFPSTNVRLVGGTSDHASWLRAGYRVCFPFEVDINPHIHTSRDTLDKLDLKLSVQHLKMGLGFIIETSLD